MGGTAATWPLAVRAQQGAVPVIGLLFVRSPEDSAPQLAAFRSGLAENGYVEGQNVTIEYRWGLGHYERMPAMAAELVRLPVNVILAGAEPSVLAAKAATSIIPIVFVVGSDPVKLRLVASYNSPGGNATGVHIFTTILDIKRLGLLNEVIPSAKLLGVLINQKFPYAQDQLEQLEAAAERRSIPVQVRGVPRATGTDANAIQVCRDGVATALVGIPNRYMHSPVEVVHLDDLNNAAHILAEFCASVTAQTDLIP